MPGGKRKQSLEERLRAVQSGDPVASDAPGEDPSPEAAPPADLLPESVAETRVDPEFAAAFNARFEALLQQSAEPDAATRPEVPPEPDVEAVLVDVPAAPPLGFLPEDSGPGAPGYRPPSLGRETDHELSAVHDQLEALRTSASEGDTLLPAGSSVPSTPWASSAPSPRRVRAGDVEPTVEAEEPDAAVEPPPTPPPSTSFLDRFSLRGGRSVVKPASEPEPTDVEDAIKPFTEPVFDLLAEPDVADPGPWTAPASTGRFGRIGAALIARGLITSEQLDTALELQRSTGRRIGDSLVDMGVISPFELVRILADHMGVPFVDLNAKPPDPTLAPLLSEEVARRYDALPIARWNGQLVIAMANPTDLFALEDLELLTRQSVIPAMALLVDLRAAIDRAYRAS